MAKKNQYGQLVDSHIKKLAEALIIVIQKKAKDVDGVELTYEEATEVAVEVIEGVKK